MDLVTEYAPAKALQEEKQRVKALLDTFPLVDPTTVDLVAIKEKIDLWLGMDRAFTDGDITDDINGLCMVFYQDMKTKLEDWITSIDAAFAAL